MATIALQFSASAGITASLIQWFGHGWCTHVDCVLPGGNLLGARLSGGVAIRPPDYQRFSRVQRVMLPVPPEVYGQFRGFLADQIGKPYDWTSILGFMADRDWRDDDSWFCSELIAAGLEAAGYFNWPLAAVTSKVTPSDLLLALSATVRVQAA